MGRYTKEQLLFYLKKLSSELKRTPTIKDMNKKKKFPSSGAYVKRFGSWNNSLRKAGLKINLKKKHNKEDMIENLKILAKNLGRTPKTTDLKNKKWIASSSTYRKYFGSWKKALKSAKLVKSKTINLKSFR